MTDIVVADVSALILSKRERLTSIRTSRKRKLSLFFGVARASVAQTADNPLHSPPEKVKFLHDNDVLQGPFLSERYLPAQSIPTLNTSTLHDAGAIPHDDDVPSAHFGKGEAGPVNPPTQVPISSEPSLPRPQQPDETRAASPTTPTSVPPVRTGHGNSSSSLDTGQNPLPTQLGHLPQPGVVAGDNAGRSESLQRPREGPVGREVTFVEPEKQGEDSRLVNGRTLSSAGEPSHADTGHHEADPDAMDIVETSDLADGPSRLTSSRPAPLEAARPSDVLSSPGSTTQTATTPAVHDASPDTSPDNGGSQYPADDDDLASEERDKEPVDEEEPSLGVEGASGESKRDTGVSQATSAQALLESTRGAIPTNFGSTMPPASSGNANDKKESVQPPHVTSVGEIAGAQSSLQAVEAVSQAVAPVAHASGREDASSSQSSTGPGTYSEDQLRTATANQHTLGPSVPVPVSHKDASTEPEAQNSFSLQVTHSTPADSSDPSHTFSGSQQPRHTESSFISRKRSAAERQGRNLKIARTVVFEKRPKQSDKTVVASQNHGSLIPTDDYFVPLFLEGFARGSSWMKSPEQLLATTHKTIASSDFNTVLQESQACKVLRRIYHLQQTDKWSLRQLKRCPEPTRPPSHWDLLLGEMKWMRTDFREESKWKRAVAQNMAEACAEWVAASDEERKVLQANVKRPAPAHKSSSNTGALPAPDVDSLPTAMPNLVPSNDADSPMDVDEPYEWDHGTVAPSAIFLLQDDEVVFGLQDSAASEQLLNELPFYQAPLKVPQGDLTTPEYDPEAQWRRPALPLSKYVEGELVLKTPGPPLRLEQSRYKYAVEDDESDSEFADDGSHDATAKLPPASTDVALFRPEMKAIRDRLHSTHQFRPPSESPMPSQSFYEHRIGSVWTPAEEDELRRQVREYSYNWSLISKNISSNSLFVSGDDRRTPWECFERWVFLEGYPPEVAKTQYFRTYHNRIESAQRAISNAAQPNEGSRQAVGQNGVVVLPQRRRLNLPSRQERKTSKRYFNIIDAMRKLAKKREAATLKQQQTASNQNRRPSENNQQKLPTKTPQDYSRLKAEREKQHNERMLRYSQQQEAQRLANMQGRVANQVGRVPGAPGVAQAAQNGAAGHVAGMANPLLRAGQGQVAGQARRMPMGQQQQALLQLQQSQQLAALRAGGGLGPQAPVNGAGMPPAHNNAAQAQPHLPVPDATLVLQARQIQEQQRRRQMAQQQARGQVHQHPQQQQGGQQQAQQLPPQHSPPQAQAQQLSPNQQGHALPNGSAAQSGSPNVRGSLGNGINSMNQNNFVMNNMGAYAPNGMAMATSPGGVGMNMQSLPAGSPPAGYSPQPRGLPVSMQAHFAEVESQIRAHNPDATAANIRHMALQRFHQVYRSKGNVTQTAMDAAAGNGSLQQAQANGIANASSPQQYAQLLRQQQQQQSGNQHAQQQAAIAQQAAARQASQPQHQRQPSGGGTPAPNR